MKNDILNGWIIYDGNYHELKAIFKYFGIISEIKVDNGNGLINFYKIGELDIFTFVRIFNEFIQDKPDEMGEFFLFEAEKFRHYIIKNGNVSPDAGVSVSLVPNK